jgi:hypothetical protein
MALGDKSKAWRDKLMEQVKVPILSQSFEIQKYYDIAAKVLEQAEEFDMVTIRHIYENFENPILCRCLCVCVCVNR